MNDDDVPKYQPRNRGSAESKLRRSRRHCPVCLAPLAKNARRTKLKRQCDMCGANPHDAKACARCGAGGIWESGAGAACQVCGLPGTKDLVIVEPVQRS